jgi:hypothetical protein
VTLGEIRSRFDRVWRESAEGFVARCPAHDDREPSLKVSAGTDGRILLYCHANCTTEAVVAALGLTMADLFDSSANGHRKGKSSARIEEAIYDYTDENGKLLYQVVRYQSPKDFKFRRPDGNGGWIYHLDCEKSERCQCSPKSDTPREAGGLVGDFINTLTYFSATRPPSFRLARACS